MNGIKIKTNNELLELIKEKKTLLSNLRSR